jgi:hypothetical protein
MSEAARRKRRHRWKDNQFQVRRIWLDGIDARLRIAAQHNVCCRSRTQMNPNYFCTNVGDGGRPLCKTYNRQSGPNSGRAGTRDLNFLFDRQTEGPAPGRRDTSASASSSRPVRRQRPAREDTRDSA